MRLADSIEVWQKRPTCVVAMSDGDDSILEV